MGEARLPTVLTEPSQAISPPNTSPAFAASRTGRKLRQKVVDELKNVKLRKSPAGREKNQTRGMLPSLELNESADDDEDDMVQDPQAINKAKGCNICERSFTVFRAKHTCKICAHKICDDCSKNRMKLNRRLERKRGSRLCDPCARNYMPTDGSGEDTTPPDSSPLLTAMHSDSALIHKEGTPISLPRPISVPSAVLVPAPDKAPSLKAIAAVQTVPNHRNTSNFQKEDSRVRHVSHLRTRHYVSLMVIALMVVLRIIYYNRRNGVVERTTVSSSSLSPPSYSFVERALDSLLSVRMLGVYFLGLVLFDELTSFKNGKTRTKKPLKKKRRRRRSSVEQRQRASLSVSTRKANSPCCAVESSAPPSPHTSQDDDLEVSVLEQNNEEEGFTLDKLVLSLEDGAKTRAPDGNLGLNSFLATCNVICGFLGVFGRATSFAGSTVGAYFTSIEQNLESWPVPSSSNTWSQQSVRAVIEHEVGLGVADVGGKKKPSCSRCLLRLLWFVQFVEACVRLTLLESTDDNCYNGASKAYEETLGKRHPWLVRKGVNTALGSIPTRSHILSELHVGEGSAMEPLSKVHAELVRLIAELKAVFVDHGLTDLK
ncbi:hypothetical protein CCR75_004693 [Bremia lactucae]|uniref:FYVE-type domain-containing protein n=1 Tax=Bremia lactucae TaxID=4779 RepID=A0A976IHT5_BRELC|nr:hypothetical protein CCR75_004693 [Bremia lactucae]